MSESDQKKEASKAPAKKRGRPRKTEEPKPVKRRRKKDWASLVEDIDEETIVEYQIDGDFTETEAIRHKSFGVGIITKVLDDNKIEVVFEEDKKVLAQNWE